NRSLRTDVDGLSSRLDARAEEASGEPAADGDDGEPAAPVSVPAVTGEVPEPDSGEYDPGDPVPGAVTGEELYARAQSLYSEQRYREAARVFSQAELLDDSEEFKARCNYWTGECMYAQGAYDKALEYFGKVFVKYGTTAKASDALLKIGFTYYEMQNYNGARQALNEFLVRFPDHRAVPFAEERLRWIDNMASGDSQTER
ncbi:MAG TPA: tetratricopeptide repeat protein, partial [bacterium]|nr:tetratricopeptide repeat protein [bacterium]